MILGIDPGTKRVGLAIADRETRFARPLRTLAAELSVAAIAELVTEAGIDEVVVGRPVSLSGESGTAVETYVVWVDALRDALPGSVSIVQYDERLTSVIALQSLRSAGVSAKKARGMVDAVAAQVMLQSYLDATGSNA